VCGDGTLCGAEACEIDADCGGGQVCQGCACVNASVCANGIGVARPILKLRASPLLARFRGEALLGSVDPAASGVRVVLDAATGPGGLDVTIPGGGNWAANGAGTRWRYRDPTGALGGITRVLVRDKSAVAPGLVRWLVKAKTPASLVLPDVTAVRGTLEIGATCAMHTWNPPSGPRPRCDGDASRLACR
jgi:hypothetical protein